MIKSMMRRAYLLVLASALVGAGVGSFHQSTALGQGGIGGICNAWEETCDDGSGGPWDSGGDSGGGDSSGSHYCKTVPPHCISLGCNGGNGKPYTCAMSQDGTDPNAVCTPGGPCS